MLFETDGGIDVLEGFTYDEPWRDVEQFTVRPISVTHLRDSQTDVEQMEAAYTGGSR